MAQYETHAHPFAPVVDVNCRILILGTFPSVKSRENAFYYGHPQNRFWKMLAAVFEDEVPVSVEEKKRFLLQHHLALWDVIAHCDIVGSGDSSIRNAEPNKMSCVLSHAPVERILLNGKTAGKLFEKHNKGLDIPWYILPSTSPANAQWTLEKLVEAWREKLQIGGELP